MNIKVDIRRVYDKAGSNEGYRVLVDRLWPRGLARNQVVFDMWSKELAPSTDLRKWFAHTPERWEKFSEEYLTQLRGQEEPIQALVREAGTAHLTLLYGARDTEHNHAVILAQEITRVAKRIRKAPNEAGKPA